MAMVPVPISSETRLSAESPTARLRLFGPMRADTADGLSFLPRNTKTQVILAVLALAEAAPVPRTLLIEMLWPSRGLAQAQASLRQSLHELRFCLAPLESARIVSEGKCLAFQAANIWIDAIFVRTPGFIAPDIEDVFRGPLLSGLLGISDTLDAWVRGERSKLSAMIRPRLRAFLAESPVHETSVKIAQAMLAHDASHEAAWAAYRYLAETRGTEGRPGLDGTKALAQFVFANAADAGAILPAAHGIASRSRRGSRDTAAVAWRGAYLAVAPLRGLGEATEALTTRMDWQIISGLYKFENMSCSPIVANDGSSGSLQNLAAEGFDFLLEGYLDRAADQERLIVRLRDLQLRGEVVWSQQVCRASLHAGLQDSEFAAALAPRIAAEIARHQAMVLENSPELERNVWELVLRASRSAQSLDRERLLHTDRLFAEAIKHDHRHPALLAWAAYIQLLQLGQGWVSEVETTLLRMGSLIDTSLSLNPESASVLSIAGHVLAFTQNRLEEGLTLQEQALAKNPNLPSAWLFSGLAHTYAGEHKEAIRRLKRARMLSPADQQAYFMDMGLSLSYLLDGDTANSLAASDSAILLNPNFSSSFKVVVSASGYADPKRDDSALLKRLLALEPQSTVGRILSRSPLTRPADRMRLADGLRLAGLPR